MLETMGRQSQSGAFRRLCLAPRIFFQFTLEYLVDTLLRSRQIGLTVRLANLISQSVKTHQRLVFWFVLIFCHKFPSRGEQCAYGTKQHRSIEKLVAVLVKEGFFVATKVSSGARVHRNISVVLGVTLISVWFADFRDEWVLTN